MTCLSASSTCSSEVGLSSTRRAYQADLEDFCNFVGLTAADEFRALTRLHST